MKTTIRAYTLIEFIITLSVVSILALVVVPGLYAFAQKQELRNAAQQLAFDLQLAKSHAIKNSTPVLVNFAPGSTTWCYSLFVDDGPVPPYSCNNTQNSVKTNAANSYRQIELVSANFAGGASYIGFEPVRGMPVVHGSARNGTIWFRNKYGLRMAVVVNRIGRVRICEVGKSGCPAPPASTPPV